MMFPIVVFWCTKTKWEFTIPIHNPTMVSIFPLCSPIVLTCLAKLGQLWNFVLLNNDNGNVCMHNACVSAYSHVRTHVYWSIFRWFTSLDSGFNSWLCSVSVAAVFCNLSKQPSQFTQLLKRSVNWRKVYGYLMWTGKVLCSKVRCGGRRKGGLRRGKEYLSAQIQF